MIALISFFSIDCKENFFKRSYRNAVTLDLKFIKLLIKVLEELLKYISLFFFNHESNFARNF